MGWWRKSLIKMFSKLWCCQIVLFLFAGFKTIILCSVHPEWFMKFAFSAKIWFVKTSTRIVKYESRVFKLNPATVITCYSLTGLHCQVQNLTILLSTEKIKKLRFLNILGIPPLCWSKQKFSKVQNCNA